MWEFAICCVLLGDVDEATATSEPTKVGREIDDLARNYRIELYDTFRTQRSVYDHWAAVGFEVLKYSRMLPAESSQQHELAGWFRDAAAATRMDHTPPPTPPLDWASVAGADLDQGASRTLPTSSSDPAPPAAKPASSLPWGVAGRLLFGGHATPPPAPAEDALTPAAVPTNELPSSAPSSDPAGAEPVTPAADVSVPDGTSVILQPDGAAAGEILQGRA